MTSESAAACSQSAIKCVSRHQLRVRTLYLASDRSIPRAWELMGERRPSSRLLSSHHRRRVRQVGRARRDEGRGRNFARRASIMLGQNVSDPIAKARSTSAPRRYHAAPLASAPERRSSRRDLSGRRDARIRSSLGKALFVGKCTAPDVPRCTRNVSDGTSAVKKELGSIVAAPISARSGPLV